MMSTIVKMNDKQYMIDAGWAKLPNYHDTLPIEIQRFTVGEGFDPLNP